VCKYIDQHDALLLSSLSRPRWREHRLQPTSLRRAASARNRVPARPR
jgi:hypothetical protein